MGLTCKFIGGAFNQTYQLSNGEMFSGGDVPYLFASMDRVASNWRKRFLGQKEPIYDSEHHMEKYYGNV